MNIRADLTQSKEVSLAVQGLEHAASVHVGTSSLDIEMIRHRMNRKMTRVPHQSENVFRASPDWPSTRKLSRKQGMAGHGRSFG